MTAQMRAARLHEPGKPLFVDRVAVPEPGPRDVPVAVKACGVIPNMNAIFSGTLWNRLPPLPAIVGLDAAGVVTKVGDAVTGVAVGARVYVNPWLTCGTCAYCGNPDYDNDRNRSIALGAMLSPLDGIDATFVSLVRDVRAGDDALLQSCRDLLHFGEELGNFADTAALVANLDIVISVDTSVAHLAGALAKPVWILLPFGQEWRWLLDRGDTPWYPTARLFRQDDTRVWDGGIARVRAALRDAFPGA
jgi:hypothetical protein